MEDIPLGKPTVYPQRYDPDLLAPMARAPVRAAMGVSSPLPFVGEDVWNGYEFSWLSLRGLPQVAGLRLRVDAASSRVVESKSMKLYLNGFAQERFESVAGVREALVRDLAGAFDAPVSVTLSSIEEMAAPAGRLPGVSLDGLDVEISHYERAPELLNIDERARRTEEALHTHLFRSLCPVTGQPDWASLLIRHAGQPLDRAGLLRYLVSYRNHQAFHEATVEQIFLDVKARCRSERLTVAGFFLRRGGLDINPVRADAGETWSVIRLPRQ